VELGLKKSANALDSPSSSERPLSACEACCRDSDRFGLLPSALGGEAAFAVSCEASSNEM
jgi:hypothetical protein